MVGSTIGLGLLRLYFSFFCTINHPSLMSRAPAVSLVFDFLSVCFPVLWLLLLPLVFSLALLRILASLFLDISLSFTFDFSFTFSGRQGL